MVAITVTLTFDNLGEATGLQRGSWEAATPLGADPSVTVALSRLLDELDRLGLRATFCVEAINCGLNPDAVTGIAARGHEIAVHGWRHEPWVQLEPDHEHELLRRARAAFAELGLHPAGFRPPGGEPSAADPGILAEHGFRRWSPAADATGAAPVPATAVTPVPFAWELVDAYWLMESFADRRARRGDPLPSLDAAATANALRAGLRNGALPRTLVMHPFLMLDPAWWEQTRGLLALVADEGCRTVGETAGGR